jgi:hypothetical protein
MSRRSFPTPIKLILIEQLHELARKLGRTPTNKEVSSAHKEGKCLSLSTFVNAFGSFSQALKAANLPLNYGQQFSRAELILQLKNLASKRKKQLKVNDIKAAAKRGVCARPIHFINEFGSINKALQAAGLIKIKKAVSPKDIRLRKKTKSYSDEELLEQLRSLAVEIGKLPSHIDVREASKAGKCASASTFQQRFGSVANARDEAGLGNSRPTIYNTEILLSQLKSLADKLGRTPSISDMEKSCEEGLIASLPTFINHFGSYKAACKAAKLPPPKRKVPEPRFSKEYLIDRLQVLAMKLGRAPSAKDIEEASKDGITPSRVTYDQYFGGVAKAKEAAGLLMENKIEKQFPPVK